VTIASGEVLLRWRLPLERPAEQRRVLQRIWPRVPSFTRPIGGVSTCYASRQLGEAWLTLFAAPEKADELKDAVRELFGLDPEQSTKNPILGPDLAWYRRRLHQVSDVALSIRDDASDVSYRLLRVTLDTLPDPARLGMEKAPPGLYEKELRRRLVELAGPGIEDAMASVIDGRSFWTDFVRRPDRNADILSPPGHWLWNLLREPSPRGADGD
jgi:hypothetical protein